MKILGNPRHAYGPYPCPDSIPRHSEASRGQLRLERLLSKVQQITAELLYMRFTSKEQTLSFARVLNGN